MDISNKNHDPVEPVQQRDDDKPDAETAPTEASSSPGMLWKALVAGALVALIVFAVMARKSPEKPMANLDGGTSPSIANKDFPPETVLATVNGIPITLADFDAALQAVPVEYRTQFEMERHIFLNELIAKELLLQEAKARKIAETADYAEAMAGHEPHPGHEDHTLISVLLDHEVFSRIDTSDAALRKFYDENKARLPDDKRYEDVKELLRQGLRQTQGMAALEDYITGMKSSASIDLNVEWIELQQQAAADNPLDQALGSGKPVLADFGSGTCMPCKMMKPILEQLAEDLKESVHVLILDLGEYEHFGRRYQLRVIPTQIFFDNNGKQLHRHDGFMSRDDMLAKMEELAMLSE